MITLTRTSGIYVPKKFENENFYQLIRNDLTRHSKDYQKSTFTTNYYFLEGKIILKIPRFYPVEERIDNVNIIDNIN